MTYFNMIEDLHNIPLTEEQDLMVRGVMAAKWGGLPEDYAVEDYNVFTTRGTLDDYDRARKSWPECRAYTKGVVATGDTFVSVIDAEGVQMRHGGERRKRLIIIDLYDFLIMIW